MCCDTRRAGRQLRVGCACARKSKGCLLGRLGGQLRVVCARARKSKGCLLDAKTLPFLGQHLEGRRQWWQCALGRLAVLAVVVGTWRVAVLVGTWRVAVLVGT
jgi:hypothetical protein